LSGLARQIRSEHWCHGHSEPEEHGEREQMYQCGDPGDVNWCVVLVQSHCVCGVLWCVVLWWCVTGEPATGFICDSL